MFVVFYFLTNIVHFCTGRNQNLIVVFIFYTLHKHLKHNMKIVAFGASNSSTSINRRLAAYTASQVDQATVTVLDLNDYDMPIYGVDYEREHGIPEAAQRFLDEIRAADALVISFAEHNGAYTTAFKNLFDWTSRLDGNLWSEKPMFALATSPGGRGGQSVLAIAMDRFRFMGGNIVASFSLPFFNDNFDDDHGVTDETLNDEYRKALLTFTGAL